MKLVLGDKVVYGPDPRKKGFALDPRNVGVVKAIYTNRGVFYVEADFGKGRRKLYMPYDSFTKVNPVRPLKSKRSPYTRGGKARRVVIKGNKFSVARAMADAGIPFLFVREAGANTVGDVPRQHIRKLSAFLDKHPQFEGRFAKLEKNPVRITSPRAGTRRQFRVYTRKHGAPWAITVKTNSVKHALDSAGKLETKGYRVRVTQVR